ncbi:MAG TPA: hypothetical protein VLJ86_19155 [Ramlibacter sp.]|nr:hypothetical protein [Ramlibacter sp.]
MPPEPNRRLHPVTLQQAAADSPTLAHLVALVRDSSKRLKAIEELIPPPLRPAVKAGPVDGGTWCLLVQGSAAAAKLRQLAPALQACLRSQGWQVDVLRIKVQSEQR